MKKHNCDVGGICMFQNLVFSPFDISLTDKLIVAEGKSLERPHSSKLFGDVSCTRSTTVNVNNQIASQS